MRRSCARPGGSPSKRKPPSGATGISCEAGRSSCCSATQAGGSCPGRGGAKRPASDAGRGAGPGRSTTSEAAPGSKTRTARGRDSGSPGATKNSRQGLASASWKSVRPRASRTADRLRGSSRRRSTSTSRSESWGPLSRTRHPASGRPCSSCPTTLKAVSARRRNSTSVRDSAPSSSRRWSNPRLPVAVTAYFPCGRAPTTKRPFASVRHSRRMRRASETMRTATPTASLPSGSRIRPCSSTGGGTTMCSACFALRAETAHPVHRLSLLRNDQPARLTMRTRHAFQNEAAIGADGHRCRPACLAQGSVEADLEQVEGLLAHRDFGRLPRASIGRHDGALDPARPGMQEEHDGFGRLAVEAREVHQHRGRAAMPRRFRPGKLLVDQKRRAQAALGVGFSQHGRMLEVQAACAPDPGSRDRATFEILDQEAQVARDRNGPLRRAIEGFDRGQRNSKFGLRHSPLGSGSLHGA